MALVIILNGILAFGVIVMVISPLVWAILTQRRDAPDVGRYGRRRRQLAAEAIRGNRTRHFESVYWPA